MEDVYNPPTHTHTQRYKTEGTNEMVVADRCIKHSRTDNSLSFAPFPHFFSP